MLIDLLRGTGRDMLTNAIPSDDADSRGKSAPATLQPAMLPGADAHACVVFPVEVAPMIVTKQHAGQNGW